MRDRSTRSTVPPLASLRAGLADGRYDAWMVHLAEGVRDGDRRPGTRSPLARRARQTLEAKGLLTDATVIVHGTALERSDFAQMRAAPTIRTDAGDGPGKLVWSPLSNLLLYGKTTNVYDALAEGVLVSLGTDWTPSGSRTLLHELKVADIALRDDRVLGASRDEVPALAARRQARPSSTGARRAGARPDARRHGHPQPGAAVRWYDEVGSIEPGKLADLMSDPPPGAGRRRTACRRASTAT